MVDIPKPHDLKPGEEDIWELTRPAREEIPSLSPEASARIEDQVQREVKKLHEAAETDPTPVA